MRTIIEELSNNGILILSIISLLIAQFLKVITHLIAFKEINISRAFGSGGMPSSHSSFISTLSTSVGIVHGFDSTLFAISIVSSLIVMYDASGVRLAVGKQAKLLNELQLVVKLIASTELKTEEKFKELVGHTKLEVLAGSALGIFISFMGYYLMKI